MRDGYQGSEGPDVSRLASMESTSKPFWAYRVSGVRELIVGREDEFLLAVERHGSVRVASFFTKHGISVSKHTINRIRREIRELGKVKLPGVENEPLDVCVKSGDNQSGPSHRTESESNDEQGGTKAGDVESESSESANGFVFMGGKGKEDVNVRGGASITRKEQDDLIMGKILKDAFGDEE